MNNLLLIGSIVLLLLGGFAVLGRNALYAAHVRRATVRRREPGDAQTWTRNLLLGGGFLVIIGVLGLIAVFGAAATAPI